MGAGMHDRVISFLLFWLLAPVGFFTLAPALLLPAWADYRQALDARLATEHQARTLERRIAIAQKQAEHLQHDPAYILRTAQHEFGIRIPGVEFMPIPLPVEPPAELPPPELTAEEQAWVPAVDERIAWFRRLPIGPLYDDPRSRITLGLLGGGTLLAALLFLGPHRRRPA